MTAVVIAARVVADDAADRHVRELVGVVAQRVLEVGLDAADAREGRHELVVAHDRHVARMDAVGGRQPAADEGLDLRGGRPDLAGSAAGLEDVRADAGRAPRDRELVGGGHRRRVRDDHHLLAAALDHKRRIAAHDLPVEQRLGQPPLRLLPGRAELVAEAVRPALERDRHVDRVQDLQRLLPRVVLGGRDPQVAEGDVARLSEDPSVGRFGRDVAGPSVGGGIEPEGRTGEAGPAARWRRALVHRLPLVREDIDLLDRVRGRSRGVNVESRACGDAEDLADHRDSGRARAPR